MTGQHRVKVYLLNKGGTWDDKGLGNVTLEGGHVGLGGDQRNASASQFVVVGESSGSTPILVSQFRTTNKYVKQGDGTIISWTDPDIGTDVALSFELAKGCADVWKHIDDAKALQTGQGGEPTQSSEVDPISHTSGAENAGEHLDTDEGQVHSLVDGRQSDPHGPSEVELPLADVVDEDASKAALIGRASPGMSKSDCQQLPAATLDIKLPDLEISNLAAISKMMLGLHPYQREKVAQQLKDTDFLRKLHDTFTMLEDLEDEENLRDVCKIAKALILLNDNDIFEAMLSVDHITDTIGMLEYDSAFPEKQMHRKTLEHKVSFKEVIPIASKDILAKVHQTFKISYIKDAVLPMVLDEATFGSLSNMVLCNNMEILQALHGEPEFLATLLNQLKSVEGDSSARSTGQWKDLVGFLLEICNLAKHLNPQERHKVLSSLIKQGLFDVIDRIISCPGDSDKCEDDDCIRMKGMDILKLFLQFDPALLRDFMKCQKGTGLLGTLIDTLLTESESGLQEQTCSVIKMLLDPGSMVETEEKVVFLDTFYQNYFQKIAEKISMQTDAVTVVLLLELVCLFISLHAIWIKYNLLRTGLLPKVKALLRRREKIVVLSALRLVRTCLATRDEFYMTHIVKYSFMEAIVETFLANGSQYNMLHSAVLELLNFIGKENVKPILEHMMRSDGGLINKLMGNSTKFTYKVFEQLQVMYLENVDDDMYTAKSEEQEKRTAVAEMKFVRMRKRRDGSMDKEEEDYFESSDSDSEDKGTPPVDAGLSTGEHSEHNNAVAVDEGEKQCPGEGRVVLQPPYNLKPLVDYSLEGSGSSPNHENVP